ncbi:MAG: hypothetical protein E7081_02820 [Bacteroidales bacterium]|nr:hypothetical protein [Bacteroidales bacterium]
MNLCNFAVCNSEKLITNRNITMQKTKKWLLLAILSLFISGNLWAETAPKREFRSVWIATVANIDWPKQKGTSASVVAQQKADLLAYIERMQEMNLTTICFQVRSMCDAMYKSSYEPWSSYLTGTRGTNPGWDPLQFCVDECHKRGLEVYAWVNPYRWSSTGSTSTWNTSFDAQVKNNGWLITNGTFTVLNPGLDATREHIVKVCKEIISNYAVEGMIFDDYFYPSGGTSEGSDAPDYQLWKNSGTSLSIGDWRRENVDKMITDVYNMVQETRPEVRFGLAPPGTAGASAGKYGLSIWPGGYDTQYTSLYSDPLSWMNKGIVDFMSPQIYWHNDHSMASFGKVSNWWYSLAKHFGNVHCSVSVNIYDLAQSMGYQEDLGNTQAHWEEHVYNVKQSRQFAANNGVKAFGSNFYSIQYFCGNYKAHGDYVAQECFPTKALVPEVDWKTVTSYTAPGNLTNTNGTLSWTAANGPHAKTIIRYSIYAVPLSVTVAQATTDDGIDGQYLVDVSYNNSFTLPANRQSGYWYAVCVYDGFGKEHPAAYIGYPDGEADKVTLKAPINGIATTWAQSFSWSAIENGTYNLFICDDAACTSVKYSKTGLTANSVTVDLSDIADFKDNTIYYWKVTSSQPGKLSASSDIASFKSPALVMATKPVLMSPTNGAELEVSVTFEWVKTDSQIESFVLQISPSSAFSDAETKSLTETTTTSFTVPASSIGLGTYYWRVVGKGEKILDTPSDSRMFTITNIGVGAVEEGYEVKYDTDVYDEINKIAITNMWMRSVRSEYDNITFADNGGVGSWNRTMVAVGDYVYLSGRSANSSTAKAYLEKYSGITGEYLGRITLGSEASVKYYPCNNVVKDSNGNVCISNLTMISYGPIVIHKVDLETGKLTQVASITTSTTTNRFDHISIVGDVTTGNFTVFGIATNTANIYRWTFKNGSYTTESKTIKSFYPTSVSAFGLAPRVIPVSTDDIFVDCSNTAFTRYTFSTGERSGSFLANLALAPSYNLNSGGTFFKLGDKMIVVYPYSDMTVSPANTFNVVATNSNLTFGDMTHLWVLPKGGLGSVDSGTYQAAADYVTVSEGLVRLYLYIPGNGISAYLLSDSYTTGVENIEVADSQSYAPIQYYNLQGVEVAKENMQSGIYIRKQGSVTSKLYIK